MSFLLILLANSSSSPLGKFINFNTMCNIDETLRIEIDVCLGSECNQKHCTEQI